MEKEVQFFITLFFTEYHQATATEPKQAASVPQLLS